MRKAPLCIAIALALVAGATQLHAVPVYSFEVIVAPNGPDGFFGLGATVSQDTIGATHGSFSMKYDVGVGGFVGARTESVVPASLNDPPGVTHVLFDLTILETYTDTFADLGITVFGHALNAPGGPEFGHQVQFFDQFEMAGLAPGTYLDQQISLDFSVGPYRPAESFNDIFGPGPTDLTVPSAFQFFINKNVLTPITVYIDNVRLVGTAVPEPAATGMLAIAAVALALVRRPKR